MKLSTEFSLKRFALGKNFVHKFYLNGWTFEIYFLFFYIELYILEFCLEVPVVKT